MKMESQAGETKDHLEMKSCERRKADEGENPEKDEINKKENDLDRVFIRKSYGGLHRKLLCSSWLK